jgi:hypothetical protein
MAKTLDTNAEKQRKQKILLAVGGVILLALLAIQLPKMMGGSSAPSASRASGATGATGASGVTSSTASSSADETAATPSAPAVPPGAPRAVLVGVTVGGTGRAVADEGQLRVFTLFDAKDPFVQQLPAETSGATSPTGEPTLSDTQPGSAGDEGDTGSAAPDGTAETAPEPAAPQFATLSVNGVVQPLEVEDTFPKKQPLFVLVGLKPKEAKIGIAGGAFTDGETVAVGLGKNVTLVNTATGARYAIKLLYVGSEPEQVAGFTKGEAKKK